MQVGQIIRWRNFRFPQFGGQEKPRWFICVGHTNKIIPPVLFYLHSTTRTEKAEPRFSFSKDTYSCFTHDCYLYFNEKPYPCSGEELRSNRSIGAFGNLDNDDMKKIYEGIRVSRVYSLVEKRDVHSSLNLMGITGLKRP